LMADLGVLNLDRAFARLAFFCHPATGHRTTVRDLADRKWVPRKHRRHWADGKGRR
jgi:hypothetical protein